MKAIDKLIAAAALALAAVLPVHANEGAKLDHFPTEKLSDAASLQVGAKLFVNYCLNCHSAQSMRYNRLTDLGLTEDQIKQNLLFSADKVGELMKIAMPAKDAKGWFGATPPDLSVIARARSSESGSGADWLYTYLRGFYRDETRPTGWNNIAFPSVGMPHVLWELQGEQVMGADHKLTLAKPGKLSPKEYDDAVGDLVAFLVWMAEPQAQFRKHLGIAVLLFLGVFFVVAYAMKRAFWKDIH